MWGPEQPEIEKNRKQSNGMELLSLQKLIYIILLYISKKHSRYIYVWSDDRNIKLLLLFLTV